MGIQEENVFKKLFSGNTNLSVRLSPIDLLTKVACFLTEENNIFITKAADLN
jgi:hypothetical protein